MAQEAAAVVSFPADQVLWVVPTVPIASALALRSPSSRIFLGTTVAALLAYGVKSLAELATFTLLLRWHGPVRSLEEWQALTRQGGWIALALIMGCPFALAVLWAAIRIARQRFSDYLGLYWPRRGELNRALVMTFAILLAWYLLGLALGHRSPAFAIESYRSARDEGWLTLYLFAVVVIAPVTEELLIRGFLLRGWSQSFLGPIGAVVLTSAIWAALHTQYDLFYGSLVFAHGILFGYLRLRSGSTTLTVLVHAAANIASVVSVVLILPYT